MSDILTKVQASAEFTMTVASLANGVARQSTMLSNTAKYPAAIVHLSLKSNGSAPTADTLYKVYLLRGDGTIRTDGAGASDAGITIENADILGSIRVTATANKKFNKEFDTSPLGPLGGEWGIAILNDSGQALHATAGDHRTAFVYYNPEILA